MRILSLLIAISLTFFVCCDDDAGPLPPQPPACLEVTCETKDEFFGKAIRNGECWTADYIYWDGYGTALTLSTDDGSGYEEGITFVIHRNSNISDTLWIGYTNAGNPAANIVSAFYDYYDLHGSFGGFNFAFGADLSYQDFLIIDYFNADTSILEGRFQVRFPQGSASPLVNAPDTMRLGCGSFRVHKR